VDKSSTSGFNDNATGDVEVNELLQQLSKDWSKEGELQINEQHPFFTVDIGENGVGVGDNEGNKGSAEAISRPKLTFLVVQSLFLLILFKVILQFWLHKVML